MFPLISQYGPLASWLTELIDSSYSCTDNTLAPICFKYESKKW